MRDEEAANGTEYGKLLVTDVLVDNNGGDEAEAETMEDDFDASDICSFLVDNLGINSADEMTI